MWWEVQGWENPPLCLRRRYVLVSTRAAPVPAAVFCWAWFIQNTGIEWPHCWGRGGWGGQGLVTGRGGMGRVGRAGRDGERRRGWDGGEGWGLIWQGRIRRSAGSGVGKGGADWPGPIGKHFATLTVDIAKIKSSIQQFLKKNSLEFQSVVQARRNEILFIIRYNPWMMPRQVLSSKSTSSKILTTAKVA